ncbi:voltage-gated potassium channel Kch [Oceanobacillus picturae]|uniref:Voltage-gated potassium channel Kch n=1 Tax=Oceanobacillus picturae TaxID=171693 RepID=A0A0U9HAG1_9BACI|nr:potassium channel family protein [Oceanobacillus picturae]GAQ19687.1 voltage-gated potassium channel Kch [Oceanobacillus picturae]
MIFFRNLFVKVVRLNNWFFILATLTLVLASSYFIYYLEPDTFVSPFEGLWWTMTTVTTVGYGDISPVTVAAKVFAMFLYIVGIGLMTIFIGKAIDFLSIRKRLKEEGKLDITTEDHIILINWTKKASITLDEILRTFRNVRIVVIDESVNKTPLLHEQVEFVSGNPANRDVLMQANLLKSKSVMIFSPEDTTISSQADGQTLLIATILEGIGKEYEQNIYTICEVTDSKHIQAFKNVSVEEYITPNDTVGNLAARSILFNGSSEIIRQLTSNQGFDLYSVEKKNKWVTYQDAKNDLTQQGALLISDGRDLSIMNRLDQQIPADARLFIICDKDAYKKVIS